nr:outer membrane beta-barrel protein [Pedobacter panaciterrae]
MKRSLLALLWVLPFLSVAQSNFKKGYVVTNSKDTLKGYVDYKESDFNPVSVRFKADPESKPRIFTISECESYSIDSLDKYERYVIDASMSREEVSNLSIGRDSTFKTDTVFLKVLNHGKNVTLFSYKDNIKKRFYMMDKDENKPVELIRNLYLRPEHTDRMVTEDKYVNQILSKMRKFDVLNETDGKKLRLIKYMDKDLLKVAYTLNDQKPIKSKSSVSRFFVGSGLTISKATYTGANALAKDDAKSKTSYTPLIAAGIDFFANPLIGKLIYRIELSLMTSKNEITSPSERHSFDQLSVALTPQMIYNFYNSNRIKVFGGLGFSLNASGYSNNESGLYNRFKKRMDVRENAVDLQSFNYSFQGTAGVVLNKKVEISLGYVLPSAISDYAYYNVVMQRYKVGVNYLFGKH